MSQSQSNVLIKICCISSIEEAALAMMCGADLLGLVSAMPSGPGVIADETISSIRDWIGVRARTVLLTSRTTSNDIDIQIRTHRPDVLQLCDATSLDVLQRVRDLHPSVTLMPVIHVRGEADVVHARVVAEHADALLLDSGNPGANVKELGGTGRVHDWTLSRKIVSEVPVPVFLAGGLHAGNLATAILTVQPAGVDVCSGVRREGVLDAERLTAFVKTARGK